MEITIRRARPQDAGEIARVHVATWRTAYQGIVSQTHLDTLDVAARQQSWREWLERPGVFVYVAEDWVAEHWVAEDSATLCGFIAAGPLREPVGTCDCEIYAIYVLAEAQQRGIGRELMSSLAGELAKQGSARPAVWVLAENPARHFYARLGARAMAEKQIEIGGASLAELAYGWDSMESLLGPRERIR